MASHGATVRAKRPRHGEDFWRDVVAAWEGSGESVAEFCRSGGLSRRTFLRWRKRLARRAGEAIQVSRSSARVTSRGISRPAKGSGFIELRPGRGESRPEGTTGRDEAGVEVELRGGRRVVVRADFDPAALRRVVETLEALPC